MGILEEILAAGGSTRKVPAVLALDGTRYVDDTGQGLIGAPDENGMADLGLDADGNLWQPQFVNAGPTYADSPQMYDPAQGGPPIDPGAGLDFTSNSAVADNWQDYQGSDATTGGGFFTFADLFGKQGKDVPFAFQQGSSSPSTNNYRLLPPEYRSARYIMRNGRIIDTQATDLRGPPIPDIGFGNNYGGPLWNGSTGPGMGYPAGRSAGYTQSFGWPGQLAPWASGTYWNG